MKQLNTQGIILSRTDYGEADRIITMLTPDHGKLRLIAKGVRKLKSKLAGGIELFSVSQLTFIKGRGGLDTLVSTRLVTYYDSIVKDIGRTMLGYDLIKILNKATEDEPEPEYFELLRDAFASLDDPAINNDLIRLWFMVQLLRLGGHSANLQTDVAGAKLTAGAVYHFDYEAVAFTPAAQGQFTADHIKFLRLAFAGHGPKVLSQIQDGQRLVANLLPMVLNMLQTHIRT